MTIRFPAFEAWDAERFVVSFPAEMDGNRVGCGISWEALQDNFGGDDVQPLDCFQANREAIEAKARHLIGKGRFELDGSCSSARKTVPKGHEPDVASEER